MNDMGSFDLRYAGGPTALIEFGGVRLLTDPTFDPPGDYPIGQRKLVKTAGPGFGADEVGEIDAVLLSHDPHPDNLSPSHRHLPSGPRLTPRPRPAYPCVAGAGGPGGPGVRGPPPRRRPALRALGTLPTRPGHAGGRLRQGRPDRPPPPAQAGRARLALGLPAALRSQ